MSRITYPLLTLILALGLCGTAEGAIADGRGIFPVVVQVRDEDGMRLPNATIRLLDSGNLDPESISEPTLKRTMLLLEHPVNSDAFGTTIVYYYGGWSKSSPADGRGSYRRELRGRVVVKAAGFAPGEVQVARKTSTTSGAESAPILTVVLKRNPRP